MGTPSASQAAWWTSSATMPPAPRTTTGEGYSQRRSTPPPGPPPASPPTLDATLEARGYTTEGQAFVQVAETGMVLSDRGPDVGTLELSGQVSPGWLAVYDQAEGGRAAERADREAILRRIPRATF